MGATNRLQQHSAGKAPQPEAAVSEGLRARPAPPERALPVLLLRARESVMATMRPILRAHGVTEQQWRVLRSLSATELLSKTELARRAVLLMPSLLRILHDLEQMKLVRLVQSRENARLMQVALTKQGARFAARVTKDIAAQSQAVRQLVGGEDVDRLLDLLMKVEKRLIDAEA